MARISDERRQEMINWYLAEDERTCLDLAFEFSINPSTAQSIVKKAGVGKSRYRNRIKNSPINDGLTKPSGKSSIRTVSGRKSSYRSHRRRG